MSARTILIMAGGTGGHIMPGLAVAHEMRQRGWQVFWLGHPERMEGRLVPQHDIPLEPLRFSGVRGKGIATLLKLPFSLARACRQARRVLRSVRPDVVLGMGGYVAFPGGLMARFSGVPLVVHEQNAVAGTANRFLARLARKVLIGFPGALPGALMVGNPVRHEVLRLAPVQERYANREGRIRLLVMGGSLGARAVNELAMAALARLAGHPTPKGRAVPAAGEPGDQPAGHGWRVIHLAGRADENAVRAAYAEIGVSAQVFGFLEDMGAAYAAADICIGRSGAAACFELALCGKPAILIPLPTAVRDHQTANAKAFEEAGAAIMMPQAELTPELLAAKVSSLRDSDGQLEKMSAAMRGLARPDAALALAITVERVGSHSL